MAQAHQYQPLFRKIDPDCAEAPLLLVRGGTIGGLID